MSEADFIRIAQAYRQSELRRARATVNLWLFGSVHATLAVEFCAADLLPLTLEVIS